MPEDYRKVVFDAYQKKKREGNLSPNLLDPTPGNVREECLIIYRERERNSKDDEILRQFFKGVDKEKGYLTVLENCLAEKFKQMPKILKGGVPKPGLRYAELLAWLIDFTPRPSTSYYKSFYEEVSVDIVDDTLSVDETTDRADNGDHYSEEESNRDVEMEQQNKSYEEEVVGTNDKPAEPDLEQSHVDESEEEEIDEDSETSIEKVYISRFSNFLIVAACLLLLLVGSASFIAWEIRAPSISKPESGEKFMYWDGDHYEPVKDGEQEPGITIIPLNLKTLKHQRKINLPDTLTSYSLGKVWYKGYGKDHEFFTDSGAYPQDIQRVLKPLTNTILTKYTSNYRYLLTRLVWFICAAFFISICGFAVSKLEKEVKAKDESQQQDPEAVLTLEEEPLVEQTEGSFAT